MTFVDLFEMGAVPIVAVAGFLLGKFWSSSELVFANRQRAYAQFSRKCVIAAELFVHRDKESHKGLMPELRDARAEFRLYASPRANALVGEYFDRLGVIVGAAKIDAPEVETAFSEAEEIYKELGRQMRRDALGWTVFGIRNWFSKDERKWRRERKTKTK